MERLRRLGQRIAQALGFNRGGRRSENGSKGRAAGGSADVVVKQSKKR